MDSSLCNKGRRRFLLARRMHEAVNYFEMNSGKEVPGNRIKSETMPAKDERRELVPVIIATIVAALGAFCLWSDLRNDALSHGDGMITSATVSRAGVTLTPTERPVHLVVPQTVPVSEPSTVGRANP
jgi:hypothetical protein